MENLFEKQPIIPPEGDKEKESQPILRVIVSRHGPKLSASGEKNQLAAYFNDHVRAGFGQMNITEGTGLARVATSPVKRAADTAKIYSEEVQQTEHRTKAVTPSKEMLAVPFQPAGEAKDTRFTEDLNTIVAMQKELEQSVRANIDQAHPDWDEESREAEIRNQIDMAVLSEMFVDAERPEGERKFKTTYGELADGFAKRYAGFARHTKLLDKMRTEGGKQPAREPYVQIDVTHSFPVTAFLKKYLVFEDKVPARSLSSEEFFERTGGIIRESGSFKMDYISGADGKIEKIHAQGSFGQQHTFEGEVNIEALRKLKPAREVTDAANTMSQESSQSSSFRKVELPPHIEGFFEGLYHQYNKNEHEEFREMSPDEALVKLAQNPQITLPDLQTDFESDRPSETKLKMVLEKVWRADAMLALEIMSGARQWAGLSINEFLREKKRREPSTYERTQRNYMTPLGFESKKVSEDEFAMFIKPELIRWLIDNAK